jgi:hypothetical protein
LAPITARASGEVGVELYAAGARHRFSAPIDAQQGRIRFAQRIPRAQADLGTGIMTITYPGDEDTRPQEVRLRAASQKAELELERPGIEDGRLKARGTISDRARGVVRLQPSNPSCATGAWAWASPAWACSPCGSDRYPWAAGLRGACRAAGRFAEAGEGSCGGVAGL